MIVLDLFAPQTHAEQHAPVHDKGAEISAALSHVDTYGYITSQSGEAALIIGGILVYGARKTAGLIWLSPVCARNTIYFCST